MNKTFLGYIVGIIMGSGMMFGFNFAVTPVAGYFISAISLALACVFYLIMKKEETNNGGNG